MMRFTGSAVHFGESGFIPEALKYFSRDCCQFTLLKTFCTIGPKAKVAPIRCREQRLVRGFESDLPNGHSALINFEEPHLHEWIKFLVIWIRFRDEEQQRLQQLHLPRIRAKICRKRCAAV